jgi:prolyl-tRNA editing enzyme YbaK/EbsC (Cys-tRNA(Pro) deacylase)
MYHPITKTIQDLLKQNSFAFKTFKHEPVRTSEEAAKMWPGYNLKQGAKAMILRVRSVDGKKFVMVVFPADKKFDNNKIKTALNAKDIRFASEEEVIKLTNGVLPGAVPPFGNLFNLPVYTDPILFENEEIVFNAGDRSFSIAMKSQDYKTIVSPITAELI